MKLSSEILPNLAIGRLKDFFCLLLDAITLFIFPNLIPTVFEK